ncbi:MAG: Ig-like domain-containing protein [Candidatus Zixiibacteriota bacterium]|nr:MAG: Ig-like domain-containing protein [candidate division Zixibacteria bacterium]
MRHVCVTAMGAILVTLLVLSCSDRADTGVSAIIADGVQQQYLDGRGVDNKKLRVTFAYPGGAGTIMDLCEVPWGTHVVVAFSEPVDPASVTSETFVAGNAEGYIEVCGNTIVFLPDYAFNGGCFIEVTVSGQITDTAGNAMGEDYEFVFATKVDP